MIDKAQKYLRDMRVAAEFVVGAVAGRGRQDFDQDTMLRYAVERALITVGEALNQLHHHAPEIAESIDQWNDIIGFRNILVHGYDVVNNFVVWDAATKEI